MGLYEIQCSECKKSYQWFSGNAADQRCAECKKGPTADDFEAAHNEIASAYLQAALELLFYQGHGELNFLKKTVSLPNGGIYLLQLQHVAGPKIDVQKLVTAVNDRLCGCTGDAFMCNQVVSDRGNQAQICECSCHCVESTR